MIGCTDILDDIASVASQPLSGWRERFPEHRPLGFMGAYVPEELLHAAGFAPVLLSHGPVDSGRAKAHLPGFTCWVVRSALDQALAGGLDGWAGVAFGQTCDAVQALADLWPRALPDLPAFFIAVPHHLAAPAARDYLLAELRRLREGLEGFSERNLSDAALRESIALYNRTRSLLLRLYAMADRLLPTELHDVLRAAFTMPRELYNPLLAELVEQIEAEPTIRPDAAVAAGKRHRAGLLLAGPELADRTLYEVLEEADARVVGDLLDLGWRHFAHPVSESGDPLAALTDHVLASLPTPTKYHPQRRRDVALLQLVRDRLADGVIFARQKFCEPHGFDYPRLKVALDEARVPHLLVELEQTPHIGQMRTRVEAFLEMVADR